MPFGIFSTPNTSAQSYWPARIAPAASCERGAATGASGFDVDDRYTCARDRAEHLVARRDPAVRRPAERSLEGRVAGFGERAAHRVHAHLGVRQPFEATERMDADAGYANAHVTTPPGSSSATSSMVWPNASRAGSGSRNRVTMRSSSFVSSTMPKPYGTVPS